jgi:hypothetical protein
VKFRRRIGGLIRELEEAREEIGEQEHMMEWMRQIPRTCGKCRDREREVERMQQRREEEEAMREQQGECSKGALERRVAELGVENRQLRVMVGALGARERECQREMAQCRLLEGELRGQIEAVEASERYRAMVSFEDAVSPPPPPPPPHPPYPPCAWQLVDGNEVRSEVHIERQ